MSLILVDGSALIYRSYYAFAGRPLTSASGEETSVVFGFLGSLLRLCETYGPAYLAVAFDVKGKTFRQDIYSAYKATRKPMPEELARQLPRLREVLEAWPLPVLELPGYEADDVMATVGRRSAAVASRVWFYTGDKDFMQLLDRRTGMLKPGRRGDEITPLSLEDIQRQYGLSPAALIDVFALSGDSSDNIPGAPGVGQKTALKLIQQFGDLDSLYARLDDPRLTPRLRRLLADHRDQVYLSQRLFRIDTDVPIELDWPALRTRLPVGRTFQELLRTLDLRRLQRHIERLVRASEGSQTGHEAVSTQAPADSTTGPPPSATPARAASVGGPLSEAVPSGEQESKRVDYTMCISENMLKGFIEKLSDDCPLAVDTETDGLRPDRARLVGVSLAARGGSALYIPVLIREQGGDRSGAGGGTLFAPASETSHLEWVRRHLGPLLRDEARVKIGHNLKFDEWILSRHGMPLGGPRFDTMVAAYVLDPGGRGYGLKELADELLDERMTTYNELFAAGDRVRDILNVPPERLAVYAAADADMTYRLHELMQARLDEAGLAGLFHEMEMPLSAVLFRMERNGIKIDLEFLSRLGREFAAELVSLEKRIYAQAGQEFNVQSPQQLSEILFKKLGLKPAKKTATGWSTDVSVLAELAEQHPLPALILEHRQLAKLQNTYVDSLPQLAEPQTGLIHTSFNQAVAATGRLSSSDPNLQNIPVRTAQGRSIRKAFIPRQEDHVLLSADYSQVELRLLAHLSGDRNLQEVFRSGGDVHRRTAALIAGVTEDRVTGAMRRRAKAINFGVIYGMGARSLAKQIAVTVKEATAFIDAYFATYPGVRAFITQAKEKARKTGFTETLLGRRRRLPDILSGNNRLRSFQERIAVNTPIQGTAADVIKLAMIELDRRLRTEKRESMLLLQVHDELLLEVPTGELDGVTPLVRDCMESVLELSVPLTVDMHVGRNWADAHE